MVQIYLGSLPGNTTEKDLSDYFSKYGVIIRLKLKVENNNSRNPTCKGYGFLTIDCRDISSLISRPHYILGREIKCEPVLSGHHLKKMKTDLAKRRLFIWGIPRDMKNSEIEKLFAKIGPVESAYRVKVQSLAKPTNFGYVTFKQKKFADIALKFTYFKTNRGKKIYVDKFKEGEPDKLSPRYLAKDSSLNKHGEHKKKSNHKRKPNKRKNRASRNISQANQMAEKDENCIEHSILVLKSSITCNHRLLQMADQNHFYWNLHFQKTKMNKEKIKNMLKKLT